MPVTQRTDTENPNVATFSYSDGYWTARTTQVVRGIDLPYGLAGRVTVAAHSLRGTKPSAKKLAEITWAIQAAIDAFLA